MLDQAVHLAASGFRVFPVRAGTKGGHLLTSWLKQATTDVVTIERWWLQWPQANPCIIPGPKAVVLDVDNRVGVRPAITALNLPPTCSVRTPNGYHLYYVHPRGCNIGNNNKTWSATYPGVDIRADRGYVVAPGSIVDGKPYVLKGDFRRLAELPLNVITQLPGFTSPVAPLSATDAAAVRPIGDYSKLPDRISVGERDTYFWGLACSLAKRGFTISGATGKAWEHFKRCEQPVNNPYTWEAVKRKIIRAMEMYSQAVQAAGKDPSDKSLRGGMTGAPGDSTPLARTNNDLKMKGQQESKAHNVTNLSTQDTGIRTPVFPSSLDKYLDRYIYIQATNQVADLQAHPRAALLNLDNWKIAQGNILIPMGDKFQPLPAVWLKHPQRIDVFGTIYYPCAERMIQMHKQKWYNEYIPPDLIPPKEEVSAEKISLALNHFKYLFNNDLRQFLYWLAFTVRYKDKRIPWAPVLISTYQGIGKGWLFQLLKLLLGPENCFMIDPSHLSDQKSAFNEYIGGTLLWIDELDPRYNFYEKMKGLITETSGIINKKYGLKKHRSIFCNVICASNHDNAIKLDDRDRRFWVVRCDAPPRNSKYYKNLFDWLRTDGPSHLLEMLNSFNMSSFQYTAPPPSTNAKTQMIDAAKSEIEIAIEGAYLDKQGIFTYDIVAMEDVREWLKRKLNNFSFNWGDKCSVGHAVNKLVEGRLQQAQYSIKFPTGSERRRLCVIRNSAKWARASAGSVTEYYLWACQDRLKKKGV